MYIPKINQTPPYSFGRNKQDRRLKDYCLRKFKHFFSNSNKKTSLYSIYNRNSGTMVLRECATITVKTPADEERESIAAELQVLQNKKILPLG